MTDADSKVTEFAELLQTEFNTNQTEAFAAYNGVKVTDKKREKKKTLATGIPRIQLSIESDVVSRWNGANGKLRDCVVKFEAQTTDGNGGLIGATNPTAAEVEAVRVLRDYVLKNYSNLTALGFTMPEVRMETSQTTTNQSGSISTSKGRFLFTYLYE